MSETRQRSYLSAVDVFGPEITEEVISILGEAKKVTFAPTHRVYNRTENQLPAKLVDKCRDILDRKDLLKRRTVFFGHLKSHDGTREHAMALAELGYSLNVIADALNYHVITLTRWKIRSYAQNLIDVPTPDVPVHADLIAMGFERCSNLRPSELKEDRAYYAKVGHAMLALKSAHVEARVAAIRKALSNDAAVKIKRSRWS